MFPSVLPLRAVLSQFLILWLTIAIESWFFQKLLKFSPKTSVEYTAVINLFLTCIGWLFFFIWQGFLSQERLEQIMGYILLGQPNPIYLTLIVAAILIYLGSFLVKWKGLELLEFLSQGKTSKSSNPDIVTINLTNKNQKKARISTQASVILIAHTCSHCVILIILYLEMNRL
ncbi:hypothetical protein BCD67_05080 [Oscillatoriales cyanobacterium USR001]|nr:hypothetical protein BCD67_05080 [Oscillatoriales cyanobacterium USR001]